jgi:hypothetical protein
MSLRCPGLSVQIGEIYFPYTKVSISESRESSTASIEIPIFPNAPVPNVKKKDLVGIVSGANKKFFGGKVDDYSYGIQGIQRVFTVRCKDFMQFARRRVITPYPLPEQNPLNSLSGHLNALISRSGLAEVVAYSLAGIDALNTTDTFLFEFPFEGYLAEALTALGKRFGFYYVIDYGGWLDIRLLPKGEASSTKLCNLKLIANSKAPRRAPFDIHLPASLINYCVPGANFLLETLKVNVVPPEANTVIVLGENSFRDPSYPESREVNYKENIPAGSTKRHYPLVEQTSKVIRVNLASI